MNILIKIMIKGNSQKESKYNILPPINSFYQISYTLYSIIGPLLCILLAVVVSFITVNALKSTIKYVNAIVIRKAK
ncbi:hypothetical protein Avbf_00679 [Armadillidium vulgare]|nr:hypothetical protein Avbf_00679 [Armadillidium vulgare]